MNIQTANRLVALRKERGYSQEDLAAKIGVSRQAVSKWERAEASPDTDNLILLARLYQVSLDELLAISDVPTSEWSPEPESAQAEDREEPEPSQPQEEPPFPFEQPPEVPNGGWNGDSQDTSAQQNPLKLTRFPYPVLITIFYLILGVSYNWWHPGWILFLTIPLYYWLALAIDHSRR